MTLSPRPMGGRIHPITQTYEEIVTIFAAMGFEVAKGRILKRTGTTLPR